MPQKWQEQLAKDGLPHNLMAEKAVLGSILMAGEALSVARSMLTPEDFHIETHRMVFRAMLELDRFGKAIDFVTLAEQLESADNLKRVGGEMFLVELTTGLPRAVNVAHYCVIILAKSQLRRVLAVANRMATDAIAETESAERLIESGYRDLLAITSAMTRQSYRTIAEVGAQRVDDLTRIHDSGKPASDLVWGIPELDEALPVEKGDLVIIGGESGGGKSGIAIQVADHNSRMPYLRRGLIFSLEMKDFQNFDRMAAHYAGIDYAAFRDPRKIGIGGINRIADAWAQHVAPMKIGICDGAGMTVPKMLSIARKFKHDMGDLDFMIIDHAQIIGAEDRRSSRVEQIDEMMLELKNGGKALNTVMIVLSQIVKGENRRPTLKDFRGSGSIYQDADSVVATYRPYIYTHDVNDKGKEEIVILKNRHGAISVVPVSFNESSARFESRYAFQWAPPAEPERDSLRKSGER